MFYAAAAAEKEIPLFLPCESSYNKQYKAADFERMFMKGKLLRGPMGFAFCFLGCAAAVWTVAARLLLCMPFGASVRFLLFQLLCVVLPGLAVHKLFGLKTTPLQTLVFSYGFGFAAVVAVYFCFAPFTRCELIPYALVVLAVLSAAVLLLKRRQPLSTEADKCSATRMLSSTSSTKLCGTDMLFKKDRALRGLFLCFQMFSKP